VADADDGAIPTRQKIQRLEMKNLVTSGQVASNHFRARDLASSDSRAGTQWAPENQPRAMIGTSSMLRQRSRRRRKCSTTTLLWTICGAAVERRA